MKALTAEGAEDKPDLNANRNESFLTAEGSESAEKNKSFKPRRTRSARRG